VVTEVSVDAQAQQPESRRVLRPAIKITLFIVVLWFFVLPLIPGFRNAATELQKVNPLLLVIGLGLEMAALFAYSMMTRVVLGRTGDHLSNMRLFRIQMSTRALSNVVPGGSAAGSALGYRLLTLSGVPGADAGFALATVGLTSALVLNVILWVALLVSIPLRGVNAAYGSAALVGILLMGLAAVLVFGLIEGKGRAERFVRAIARKLRLDEDRVARVMRYLASRVEELMTDRQMLRRVVAWALANWLLDAAALWVFLRAFGGSVSLDGLLVAFGLANVMAVIPITPGGLGIVEWVYIPTLVGFGLTRSAATLGVISYRIAQFWIPLVFGGLLYLSLRVGPWSIERRDRLRPLGEVYEEEVARHESMLDFAERFPARDRTGQLPLPILPPDDDLSIDAHETPGTDPDAADPDAADRDTDLNDGGRSG
jgi:putative heme transporter